jgi:hypothetical protein
MEHRRTEMSSNATVPHFHICAAYLTRASLFGLVVHSRTAAGIEKKRHYENKVRPQIGERVIETTTHHHFVQKKQNTTKHTQQKKICPGNFRLTI